MKAYQFGSSYWRTIQEGNEREWILSNGMGGFAGHTIIGGGNRMYHGYLIASRVAPVERVLVLTRTQEVVEIGDKTYDLTSQNYMHWPKEGHQYLTRFTFDGIPTYSYQVEDVTIEKSIAMEHGKNTVVVCYEIENGETPTSIRVVPLFNCKSPGESMDKSRLVFDVVQEGQTLTLTHQAHQAMPIQFYASEGSYYDRSQIPMNMTTPNYVYEENHFYQYENTNGNTSVDSHYTPYEVQIKLAPYEKKRVYMKCTIDALDTRDGFEIRDAFKARQEALIEQAGYNDDFADALVASSDNFIVHRASTDNKTILAGYPWFTDWGRDTMIAFHGLTLSTKRYEDAKSILRSFAQYVKNGLIPNVFPSEDEDPAYNTADGSLWYFYAVDQYLAHTGDYRFIEEEIYPKLQEIVEAYKRGTDFSIGMAEDGLINAGDGSCQLTWMDVMIGDWVVTPRTNKPVEINALWYNALCVMDKLSAHYGEEDTSYQELANKVKESFITKLWNEEGKYLNDCEGDTSVRCNQIWAVSLPYTMLSREQEKQVVQKVYKELYNVYGLRSLSPKDPAFVGKYEGKLYDRDACYHMGTTWGYPIGAFITAYCKVNDYTPEAVKKAEQMCKCFTDHLNDGCINGIAEIFDGLVANRGRGCYTQAWSVSEVLRAYTEDVLAHQ